MIMYVFQYVEQVTSNWHSGGGVMILAYNERHALELVEATEDLEITAEEWQEAEEFQVKNDFDYDPKVYIFPDAGCC